jgi:predicted DCC family thiol-disulfide oxidoreductase YuxK
VRYVSFRTAPGIDQDRAVRRILSRRHDGVVREGMDVLIQITARSPCLWGFLPLLVFSRLVFGQRLYDTLARRRLVIVPGGCDEHCPTDRTTVRS